MALRTIMGELVKVPKNESDDYSGMTAEAFMRNFCFKKDEDVFYEIGIRNASSSQLADLDKLPLTQTYSCLKLFFHWVDEGFYDYSTLPFSFKIPLSELDQPALVQIIDKWTGTKSKLMKELQQLIDALKQSEQHITSQVNEAINVSFRGSNGRQW